MATTRIMPMHLNKGKTLLQSLSARTEYVMNPDKTEERELVSAYECSPETVEIDFMIAKQEYKRITGREPKHGRDVIAYHVRQSFYPGEITAEDANQMGYNLAMEFTKGEHQFIVATHVDKAHIHNHIVINSTTLDCTHKFNNYKNSADVIRDISDRQCLEKGYSVITEPAEAGKTYAEWNAEKTGNSWKAKLRNHINEQLIGCKDFEELLGRMEQLGYEIKRGKHISFRAPEQKRFTRMKSLGEEFTEEKIREKLQTGKSEKSISKNSGTQTKVQNRIPSMIDVEKKIAEGRGRGYANWAKKFNLKAFAESLLIAQQADVLTYEALDELVESKSQAYHDSLEKLKSTEARQRELKALRQAMYDYGKTREVYKAFQKSGKSEEFYQTHTAEIMLHENAKKVFDSLGTKSLPKLKDVQAELDHLSKNQKEQYLDYKEKREDLQKWQTIKQNLSVSLDPQEKEKRRGLDR